MQNKRILIITYYWPPSAGVGVHRWMHFAINLQKMGWEPIIYTPSNPQFDIKDEHLLNYVKDLRVIKEEIWEPFNFFHKPNGRSARKDSVSKTGAICNLFIICLRDAGFISETVL